MAVKDKQDASVVMPVQELHGRVVWDETGERLGTVRDVVSDDEGRIVSLELRGRWMLGSHRTVAASGMRLEGGDVIVPPQPMERDRSMEETQGGATARPAHMPVFLSGREGARSRFGGADPLGSLFGALVAFGSLVLLGGILAAIFSADPATFDTSVDSWGDVLTTASIVGAVTLFLSFFLGGWAAGRSSRYDGVANGMLVTAWFLVIGLVLGALGAAVGEEWNVFGSTNLPTLSNDEWALAGGIAALVALGLMLVGGILGGMLGESWHRRADRAMLDVVPVGGATRTADSTALAAPGTDTSGAVRTYPVEDASAMPQRTTRME